MVEPCGTPRRSKRFWDSKSLSPKVERPFKFLSTNIWPYLAWVLRWYAYSAACERVSRWSIVLKAFRGSQRWGRSNTDGIDRTSELVILWASFAWIYVNFHVWTAEIPISATGVWIPKGVLTLTTPGFYMLSLYIYIYIYICVCVSQFPCETYTDSISSYSPALTRKMDPPTIKDLLHGDLKSPWWALIHESSWISWIIYKWWIFHIFPSACLITHGQSLNHSFSSWVKSPF